MTSSDILTGAVDHASPGSTRPRTGNMRKRHSFFGRSESSDTSNNGSAPPLLSTTSCQSVQTLNTHPSRPVTAMSEFRRRHTEPDDTQRRSIFSGRKRSLSKTLSYMRSGSVTNDSEDDAGFKTEEDYYRHIKKTSISPPFNFQHVTHTNRKQLPALETVDEQELTREFWAVSAYQHPRRRLNGIQAEDLTEKLGAMGVSRGAPSSRPVTPTSSDSASEYVSPRNLASAKHPRRRSSLNTPDWRVSPQHAMSRSRDQEDLISEDAREQAPLYSRSLGATLESVPETQIELDRTRSQQLKDRSKQPLPALPSQGSQRRSNTVTSVSNYSEGSLARSITDFSPKSRYSLRSLPQSSAGEMGRSTTSLSHHSNLNAASWEDVVDFCYEQEAESTCNFDWEQHMPIDVDEITLSVSPKNHSYISSAPVGNEVLGSGVQRKHSPSVGHRGFSEARKHSMIMLDGTSKPLTLEDNKLSPLVSVMPAIDGTTIPMRSPAIVHFPDFDGPHYPSDPESGSQHRKSSSYGSYESMLGRSRSSQDLGRTSTRSSLSVPELMHSGKNRDSWMFGDTNKPRQDSLLTLPENPEDSSVMMMKYSAARRRAAQSSPDVGIMRRPETAGDRAVLQAAGRAVKQGRRATPQRFSQLLRDPTPERDDVDDGPAWI